MPEKPTFVRGYTLIELLTVISILAVSAAIIVPNISSTSNHSRLDASATEVLNALRQAQNRSETDGVFTAIRIQENTTIEVLEVDASASPPEATATQIIHPLTKRPYVITLSERPTMAGISFDTTDGPFVHPDSSTTEFLFFDPRGRPYVVGGSGIGALSATNLSVVLGALRRDLAIDTISGRARIEDS